MSQLNANDRIRSRYLDKLGAPPNKRVLLQREIGAITGDNVVKHAVKRCKAKAYANPDIYDSWDCHVGTQQKVLDEVKVVVRELDLPQDREEVLWKEIKHVYAEHSVDSPTVIG
jgi:hypothetical protein